MSLQGSLRASQLLRPAAAAAARPTTLRLVPCAAALGQPPGLLAARRLFAASSARPKGVMPHTNQPAGPGAAKTKPSYGVVDLSESEYHELADAYLDSIATKFDQLLDTRKDIDIDFSVRVFSLPRPFYARCRLL